MIMRRIKLIAVALRLLSATAAFAQEVNVVPTEQPFAVVPGSCFYLALMVGVILSTYT